MHFYPDDFLAFLLNSTCMFVFTLNVSKPLEFSNLHNRCEDQGFFTFESSATHPFHKTFFFFVVVMMLLSLGYLNSFQWYIYD